jgi:hypothetical protein
MPLPESLPAGVMPVTRGAPPPPSDSRSIGAAQAGRGAAIRREGGVAAPGGGAAAQAAAAVAAGIPSNAMPATIANHARALEAAHRARIQAPQGAPPARPLIESGIVAEDVAQATSGAVSVCALGLRRGGGLDLVLVPVVTHPDSGLLLRTGTPVPVPVPAGIRALELEASVDPLDAQGFEGVIVNFPALGGRLLVLVADDDLNAAWLPGQS